MPSALVVEPDRKRHWNVRDVVEVEPRAEAEFQCMETGSYRTHERCEEDIFAPRIFLLFINIDFDHEEHQEEAVECMDFYNPEIKGNECQYEKNGELCIVQPAKNEAVAAVQQRFDMPNGGPLEQCDGDHAREPARDFTDFAGEVQKAMSQDPADSRCDGHKKEKILDLLVHAVRAAEFVQLEKGVDAHGGHHQAGKHRRWLQNGYSE